MRPLLSAALFLLIACARAPAPQAAAVPPAAPRSEAPRAAPASPAVAGRVLETMDAASYTYVRLATAEGEQWAAVPATPVAVGSEVTLASVMPMRNFTSKTLGRTFALIYFSTGFEGQRQGPPHAAAPAGFEALDAWADSKGKDSTGKAAAPAAGAQPIAEVYRQRAALVDRAVLVQGRVVKLTTGVLGKNWVHLRDGSGSAQGHDDDLAITTTDDVKLGDVVAVRGAVHLERDFGAGYLFPVILEDARVIR
jgi:hypothetical protein